MAQCMLGLAYSTGYANAAKDMVRAVSWFRKAAEQNNADAQYWLGVLNQRGDGIAKDEVAALTWYRKAGTQVDVRALRNLGTAYQHGLGVAIDLVQAVHWYRRAAERGRARSQCSLGEMYMLGRGCPKRPGSGCSVVPKGCRARKCASAVLPRTRVCPRRWFAKGRGAVRGLVS